MVKGVLYNFPIAIEMIYYEGGQNGEYLGMTETIEHEVLHQVTEFLSVLAVYITLYVQREQGLVLISIYILCNQIWENPPNRQLSQNRCFARKRIYEV